MSIQEISSNFKRFLPNSDTTVAGLLILVGITSFFLGRASVSGDIFAEGEGRERSGAVIHTREVVEEPERASIETFMGMPVTGTQTPELTASEPVTGGYVASKSGTKYHLPWCGGAKQIKEENKIWFSTKEEAEEAGYTPALNCKGI